MNSDISLASEEGIERKGKRGRKKLTKLLAVYLAMCINTSTLLVYDVCLQLHY